MNEMESLLSQFQTNEQSTPLIWGKTPEQKPTPEDEDSERLEQSIRDVFSNKQLLNKALATFLGVFAANAGVSLTGMTPASLLAPVPLAIALGLFVGKAAGIYGFARAFIRAGQLPPLS